MASREDKLEAFLDVSGWSDAQRHPLAGDASTRRYERLDKPSGRAVLMNAPPDAEAPACPADASVEERRALGYNAVARLAGPDSGPFVALSRLLTEFGFSAPRVLASDLDNGFLLLEDLGDELFARVFSRGADETELYGAAIDVLSALHTKTVVARLEVPGRADYTLADYDDAALSAETELLIDWFWPLAMGADPPAEIRQSYKDAWADLWPLMHESHPVLVLRDYHAENLIWLADRQSTARVGLIDFQDAVLGSRAYDLVSLLEDARRDVPAPLADQMLKRYCAQAKASNPAFDERSFRRSYAALGAQRNAKIIGIFARLYLRDGKAGYLDFLPRVWRYFEHDLEHGAFDGLQTWFDDHIPSSKRGALQAAAGGADHG